MCWFDYVIVYFFSNFVWLIQRINNLSDSFKQTFWVIASFYLCKAIGNIWSICLGVNILSPVPVADFNGNNLLLIALITNSVPLSRFFAVLRTFLFFLSSLFFSLALLLKFKIYSIKSTCSSLASCIVIYHYKYFHPKILVLF